MKWLDQLQTFDWDQGNQNKNFIKHQVTDEECEEVFFDPQKRVARDEIHSDQESRYLLLGETKRERLLFVVFAIRGEKIRIISARDLNKRERNLYEETN
ncbi:MAG: BrnT family toxin [Candidatus Vogelbacteria bacterium]|nr:BrnT family toxin [Candidatus Vogelbacteria bacterium]